MRTSIQFGDGGVRIDLHTENGDPQNTYLVLMGEDDLRRIIREEIAAAQAAADEAISDFVSGIGGQHDSLPRLPRRSTP